MNVLVSGVTGFMGRWLVDRLRASHVVYGLARKSEAFAAQPEVKVIQQDLSKPLDRSRLPGSMDAIIHLAQSRHFRKFPDQAQDIFRVNTESTVQLLEYARKAKARVFVYASSGGVCGYQPHPIRETDPPQLMNFYLASKFAAECLVSSYSDLFTTVILRYFFVYGEGQRDMFMPGLVARVCKGDPVTVSGKTGVTMNPIHVSDAVDVTLQALDMRRAETVNVAGEETTTIYDLAQMIGELAGREPVYQFEPDKGPMAMVANIEKMKLKLGVAPRVSLKEGLDLLVRDIKGEEAGAAR